MFVLVEEVPWSQAKKEDCSSNCAYVKMKELVEMMDTTNIDKDETTTAPTRNGESEDIVKMMNTLFGKEQGKKMKIMRDISRLTRYCFKPADGDTQSTCFAYNLDPNVMEYLGVSGKFFSGE